MLKGFLGEPGKLVSKPSLLLKGPTGAGKTDTLGKLAADGLRVLDVDIERRGENVQKYGVLFAYPETLDDLRELLIDVLPNREKRQELVKRLSDGKLGDIDVVGIDSIVEVLDLLDRELRGEYPTKGGDKSYERWDQYGIRGVGFAKACRDLASGANGDPLGVIVTMGVVRKVSPTGEVYYDDFLKGNIIAPKLPFQFTYVMQLTSEFDGKEVKFILQTAGEGLKGPGTNVLPPACDVTGTGMQRVWRKLCKHATQSDASDALAE